VSLLQLSLECGTRGKEDGAMSGEMLSAWEASVQHSALLSIPVLLFSTPFLLGYFSIERKSENEKC